jgi:hypothetical protein
MAEGGFCARCTLDDCFFFPIFASGASHGISGFYAQLVGFF